MIMFFLSRKEALFENIAENVEERLFYRDLVLLEKFVLNVVKYTMNQFIDKQGVAYIGKAQVSGT